MDKTLHIEKIKFPIHDTHLNKIYGNLRNACILAVLAPLCFLWRVTILPHMNKYKSFYSNYDPMDSFDRMQTGGYLSSCPKEKDDKKK
ncbi:uncharacterized protein LOC117565178 [Drosophila albomicans]|uniref:Uncharacterized protein LOC117565178 n=1 Tax=Drosophila albomicans TaxID=7291 RepID=A0A9C6SYT7_DROAB|nr:uncharacterized protein LOC117565178 [Drosophila albomicans]